MSSNGPDEQHDLIIIGGGIGGIISLKYAKAAGLDAILLEKSDAVGGLARSSRLAGSPDPQGGLDAG